MVNASTVLYDDCDVYSGGTVNFWPCFATTPPTPNPSVSNDRALLRLLSNLKNDVANNSTTVSVATIRDKENEEEKDATEPSL